MRPRPSTISSWRMSWHSVCGAPGWARRRTAVPASASSAARPARCARWTAGPVTVNSQYTGSKRAALAINEPVGGGTLIGVFAPGSLTAEVRHLSAWGQQRLNAPGVVATVGASIGFGVVCGALAVRAWVGRIDASGANNASLSATVAPAEALAVGKLVCVALRWGGSSRNMTLDVLSTQQRSQAGLPGGTQWDPTTGGFFLGADSGTTFSMSHGATLLYGRELGDEEVQAAYAQLKVYFARRGVGI
jgi:hypothetical protein